MKQVPLPKIPGNWCLRKSNEHITPNTPRRGSPASVGGAFVPGGPSPAQVVQIPSIFTSSRCWCNPAASAGNADSMESHFLPWKNHKSLVLERNTTWNQGHSCDARGELVISCWWQEQLWQSPARSPKITVVSITPPPHCSPSKFNFTLR